MSARIEVVQRCCRLSEDECARRCTALPGGCDTLGAGLASDGLLTILRGREVVEQPDGSIEVVLDLIGVDERETSLSFAEADDLGLVDWSDEDA
jgi:hypothetical protein